MFGWRSWAAAFASRRVRAVVLALQPARMRQLQGDLAIQQRIIGPIDRTECADARRPPIGIGQAWPGSVRLVWAACKARSRRPAPTAASSAATRRTMLQTWTGQWAAKAVKPRPACGGIGGGTCRTNLLLHLLHSVMEPMCSRQPDSAGRTRDKRRKSSWDQCPHVA